jgi:hypothetical protein
MASVNTSHLQSKIGWVSTLSGFLTNSEGLSKIKVWGASCTKNNIYIYIYIYKFNDKISLFCWFLTEKINIKNFFVMTEKKPFLK